LGAGGGAGRGGSERGGATGACRIGRDQGRSRLCVLTKPQAQLGGVAFHCVLTVSHAVVEQTRWDVGDVTHAAVGARDLRRFSSKNSVTSRNSTKTVLADFDFPTLFSRVVELVVVVQ